MNVQSMIEALNRCLALEYAAIIQHAQHRCLLQGLEREYLAGFFHDSSRGSLEQAERLGEKIVALGGLPTVEPGTIRQANEVKEMLRQALDLEREAQKGYHAALQLLSAENEPPEETALRVMLEDFVEQEQRDIEKIEMLLASKSPAVSAKEVRLRQAT